MRPVGADGPTQGLKAGMCVLFYPKEGKEEHLVQHVTVCCLDLQVLASLINIDYTEHWQDNTRDRSRTSLVRIQIRSSWFPYGWHIQPFRDRRGCECASGDRRCQESERQERDRRFVCSPARYGEAGSPRCEVLRRGLEIKLWTQSCNVVLVRRR